MDTVIRRLRSEAQQLARGKVPRAIRYPPRFRTAAVKVARAHVGEGGALADLAAEMGVSAPTLQHWLERPATPGSGPSRLSPPHDSGRANRRGRCSSPGRGSA